MTLIGKRKFKRLFSTVVLGAILVFGVPYLERALEDGPAAALPAGSMSLFVFDVGQGDAILAQEGDKQILIDGGPDDSVLEKLGATMPAGDRKIDLVILTHPHSDHVAGLAAVLERYSVGRIVATDVSASTVVYRRWKELIAEKAIVLDDPQKVKNEVVGNMEFDVLSSNTGFGILGTVHDGNSDGYNDSSIVGMLKFGSRRFLLMGDATTVVEDALRQAGKDIKADFLKIGHHGSTYSTSDEFVKAVAPEYSAISVGKNSYGNPAWRVTQLISDRGINGYRTDLNGDVVAVTDGDSLQVTAEKIH